MLKPTEKIWHNGRFIAWDDAKIHVLSHVISYGSSVFEGIRCYATRLRSGHFPAARAHAPPARFRQDLSHGEFRFTRRRAVRRPCVELVRVNKLESCYVRPLVLRGYGDMGVLPVKNPDRGLHRLLGVGQVSGRGSAGRGRRRLRLQLDPASRPIPCPRWPRPARIT